MFTSVPVSCQHEAACDRRKLVGGCCTRNAASLVVIATTRIAAAAAADRDLQRPRPHPVFDLTFIADLHGHVTIVFHSPCMRR